MKTVRNDIHRPSSIVPADYTYCDSFSFATVVDGEVIPAFNLAVLSITRKQGGTFAQVHESDAQCDICGAHYVHGDLWLHEPTSTHITIGQQCASKMGLVADRNVFLALRDKHVHNVMQYAKRVQVWRRMRASLRENRAIAGLLKVDHDIAHDIRSKFMAFGTVTPGQLELLSKLEKQVAERKAQEAQYNWTSAPTGKQRVTGKVVHTKYVDNPYGYGASTLKMLVIVTNEDGTSWKCWGTCPTKVWDRWETNDHGQGHTPIEVKGTALQFTATFEPSSDDKGFAFFKRPSKVVVL